MMHSSFVYKHLVCYYWINELVHFNFTLSFSIFFIALCFLFDFLVCTSEHVPIIISLF